MKYVDKEYYNNAYMGAKILDDDEFVRLEKRASEIIDQLTNYRVVDINELPEFIKERVKHAVCAQIEHYVLNDGYESTMQQSGIQSVRIGSFSYSQGTGRGSSDSVSSNMIGSNVVEHLKPTGLLYSGIGVRHDY